jgi:hypothetical protein
MFRSFFPYYLFMYVILENRNLSQTKAGINIFHSRPVYPVQYLVSRLRETAWRSTPWLHIHNIYLFLLSRFIFTPLSVPFPPVLGYGCLLFSDTALLSFLCARSLPRCPRLSLSLFPLPLSLLSLISLYPSFVFCLSSFR